MVAVSPELNFIPLTNYQFCTELMSYCDSLTAIHVSNTTIYLRTSANKMNFELQILSPIFPINILKSKRPK
jgi:hypothetical protein